MPTITKIGSSYGLIIDKATLAASGLQPGDDVVIAPVPDGVVVAARHSRRGKVIEAMLANMAEDADAYRILAAS
jgi:antitoxin component of MazEF toxin-antitoxin module